MKQIIPYNENIVFETKIAEISSISLEHEWRINANEINGDFIISGDYKTHEVSVNKDPFLYRLPFSVTMPDNFDMTTVEFEIRDFTYDILNEDTLNVNIEFSVDGEELKVKEAEKIEVEEIELPQEELKEPEIIFEEPDSINNLEDFIDQREERIDEETQETIISSLNIEDDSFVTYHVHIIRDSENIENICAKYNVSVEMVKSLNNIEEINIGDKIIIPQVQNE